MRLIEFQKTEQQQLLISHLTENVQEPNNPLDSSKHTPSKLSMQLTYENLLSFMFQMMK